MTIRKSLLGGLACASIAAVTLFAGCEQKGPAEKAGENIDKAGQDIKNAVNPPGPAEKAGQAVDNATKR